MKRYQEFLEESDPELLAQILEENPDLKERLKMALGKGKSSKSSKGGKSSGKSKKSNKDNSNKRYVGSIWENEGNNGTYLSMSVDNLDPDSEYHKGNLIWFDKETGQYYKVKSMSVYGADKGPRNLTNKLVLDLENEYHVEPLEE